MTTDAALRRTPLYEQHRALGARMVPFAGYEMPIQYAGIVAEHRAVREAAGLFDLSHMGEFHFDGPKAQAAVDRLVSSDIAGLATGQARYGLLCNERGTIVDDVIVYRTGADHMLMVVNAANIEKDEAHVRKHLSKDVSVADRSADTALIAIQGPRAADILVRIAGGSVAALPPFGVKAARAAGAEATIARTGYTGEDGFEVFIDNADAVQVWQALLVAGRGDALVPVGLGARDTLRLEARFSLYGNDIDETTGPIEAGLGWTCKLDKEFVGRDAIAKQKADGPKRRIVGLVVDGGVARHGYDVISEGKAVGQVTSGTYGPTVAQNIALAYVPTELSKVGTTLAVRIREKDVPATVVKTPFYRRAP
ncbi:MAG TPA: glycine cleavage system aminomethyltransferase GcvT [Candidatus Limnocylindria bacterium]|jgi:aminomethyltransferase|nr:glycine cleavage system aminomethyltransferase GcvT [Candidatus Limnocylindria bacterium]